MDLKIQAYLNEISDVVSKYLGKLNLDEKIELYVDDGMLIFVNKVTGETIKSVSRETAFYANVEGLIGIGILIGGMVNTFDIIYETRLDEIRKD